MVWIDRLSGRIGRSSAACEALNPAQYIACMKKRTQTGFTLYELLITFLIVGTILAFGIPNFAEFTQNSRMTSSANDLHAAFHMARSEAARAKTNITICASANSMDAGADCGGTWDQGFIVFIDDNFDRARAGATETVLRAHPKAEKGVSYLTLFRFLCSNFHQKGSPGDFSPGLPEEKIHCGSILG